MNETDCQNVVVFRKEQNGKELFCRVQIFADGSAYVDGDDMEVGFEESPDAYLEALTFVESQGYTRIAPVKRGESTVHGEPEKEAG